MERVPRGRQRWQPNLTDIILRVCVLTVVRERNCLPLMTKLCLHLNLKDHSSGFFLHIVSVDNYNNTANHNLKHANQTINFLHIPDIHYSL